MNRLNHLRLLALSAAGMGYGLAGLSAGLDENALDTWVDRAALWMRERVADPRWGAWAEVWLKTYEESANVEDPVPERRTMMLPIPVKNRATVVGMGAGRRE